MTKDFLKALLQQGERISLECKKAENKLPSSLWETYSAFANTYGGIILLGVIENMKEQDYAKRFTISGVQDAGKLQHDLWNMLNNKEKVNVNLLRDEDVEMIKIDGKEVISIRVPQARYNLRPVYINNNWMTGTYKRNHEGDYHCSDVELRMMFRDSNEESNDELPIEYYTMDDIDIPTLDRYRRRFQTENPDHIWNDLDNKSFLRQLGGYYVDRQQQKEGLTMAGLLMFGKGLSIRERFSNLRLDFIDKSNLEYGERYSDRLTYDGTWENNLYNFMRMVTPRLTQDLPRPFKLEGMQRKDDTPLHKAVREAFTNSIIHADFMINGILKVEKLDNGLIFTNPGLLKLPLEQIYAGGESKARNQHIQIMLRMIGLGENIGSGFPSILKAWQDEDWECPVLTEQPDLLQVKLQLKIKDYAKNVTKNDINKTIDYQQNETENDINNVTKSDVNDIKDDIKGLTERQQKIYEAIKSDGTITSNMLAEQFKVSWITIQRDIKILRETGLITRKGSRSNGEWMVL